LREIIKGRGKERKGGREVSPQINITFHNGSGI